MAAHRAGSTGSTRARSPMRSPCGRWDWPIKPKRERLGSLTRYSPFLAAAHLSPFSAIVNFVFNKMTGIIRSLFGSDAFSVNAQLYDLTGAGFHALIGNLRRSGFMVGARLRVTMPARNGSVDAKSNREIDVQRCRPTGSRITCSD